jgi:V/A-type H+-transporting ATPase subunit I
MIVSMRHITLLCLRSGQSVCLDLLGKLGIMHMDIDASESAPCRLAQARLERVGHALQILRETEKNASSPPAAGQSAAAYSEEAYQALMRTPTPPEREPLARADLIVHLDAMRGALHHEIARLDQEIERCRPFGEFDVSLPSRLAARGVPVTLFRSGGAVAPDRGDGPLLEVLGIGRDRTVYGVAIGPGELPEGCEAVPLPEAPLSALEARRTDALAKAREIVQRLRRAAGEAAGLEREAARQTGIRDFANAVDAMRSNDTVAWITGWLPADQTETLREAAADNAWGVLIRDPEPDEAPPTLLRPPRIFRPVLCLFEALGITPGYHEADISVPFFCFFGIFFAMLVGDGGYGALLLLATLYARRKLPAAPRAPFVLLGVFSAATIVWGALSNTWFGTHPRFADTPVSAWLNHPEAGTVNMMLLCFTLGVIHLSMARAWNAAALFPDRKWLAELGWIGIIGFMYCMACSVVGIFAVPAFIYPVFVVSVLLLFLFTLKRSELRTEGIVLGMLPLNIVGALGDIISYVRLFAVGLASVKVAENFNDMAVNNGLPLWAKIVPMILILLAGHGLNLAMAGLSILVHAVRLNTLEFSNHKGITWAGRAFRPFRQRNEELGVRN